MTDVECKSPSLCAVPAWAYVHLDRRLTAGETKRSAVAEVKGRRSGGPESRRRVEVLRYAEPSYTGLMYETEKYFPTWCEPEDALQVRAAIKTHREVLGRTPIVDRWTFSTNAVAIAGMHGIPCVGFGPAPESVAHTVNDSVPIKQMVQCAAFYAQFGQAYCDLAAGRAHSDSDDVPATWEIERWPTLKGKDYIETQDLSLDELNELLAVAAELKTKFHRGEPTLLLPHQTAFLLFFDKSTRTRNAFEAGDDPARRPRAFPGR